MSFTTVLRTDRLTLLRSRLPTRARQNVDDAASEIRERGNQMAPRDTGSLAESLYVSNGETSDYSQRSGAARARNRDAVIVQEVRPEFVMSLFGSSSAAYMSVVGAAVAHGVYQELGTRYVSAHPFLIPAVEGAAAAFVAAMGHVADT